MSHSTKCTDQTAARTLRMILAASPPVDPNAGWPEIAQPRLSPDQLLDLCARLCRLGMFGPPAETEVVQHTATRDGVEVTIAELQLPIAHPALVRALGRMGVMTNMAICECEELGVASEELVAERELLPSQPLPSVDFEVRLPTPLNSSDARVMVELGDADADADDDDDEAGAARVAQVFAAWAELGAYGALQGPHGNGPGFLTLTDIDTDEPWAPTAHFDVLALGGDAFAPLICGLAALALPIRRVSAR